MDRLTNQQAEPVDRVGDLAALVVLHRELPACW
jgi:hypothetical protein